jgi:succinate-semialdehyde dehydrogenase/glutarate-semialdehyde dehydrogenase
MNVAHQEIFGPIAPLFSFESDDQVIYEANNTTAGLASYIYTKDINRVYHMTESLQYGMVGVNTGLISNAAAPFGGIKESGLGREGGVEGIEEYLDTKYVCVEIA